MKYSKVRSVSHEHSNKGLPKKFEIYHISNLTAHLKVLKQRDHKRIYHHKRINNSHK